ncbi:MAG TPA: cation diffusion facilitator family transporter, partial [Woeseiaceae bacterium]|nr:cation diffusion facilitator family transporter [Woeseiaceae bacterium]
PLLEMSDEEWRTMYRSNADTAFLSLQAEAREMKAAGGGAIVNIASIAISISLESTSIIVSRRPGSRRPHRWYDGRQSDSGGFPMARGSTKVIIAALLGNTLIAISKFAAAAFTGSSAMVSEGIHSLVDTGNQALLLHGVRRSKEPPDDQFPFGHGKEVYFWSFIVAVLIFAAGAGLSIYEGIRHLLEPRTISHPLANYIVLALAFVFEGVSWTVALLEFNRTRGRLGYFEAVRNGKDPTLFVVLFEDTAAMLGLIIALAGLAAAQLTGIAYFDGIASILIGVVLAAAAAWLAFETKSLLIGESASRRVIEGIRKLVLEFRDVKHINEILTMHMGPDFVLLNLAVKFSDDATASELEATVSNIEKRIKTDYPQVKRVFVEAEKRRDVA